MPSLPFLVVNSNKIKLELWSSMFYGECIFLLQPLEEITLFLFKVEKYIILIHLYYKKKFKIQIEACSFH